MTQIATATNSASIISAPKCAVKNCKLCSRKLPVSEFYRRGKYHHSYCKPCHRDRTNELRDAKRLRSNTTYTER